VLQTILMPLVRTTEPSRITIEGGTHNKGAPPFDFLAKTFLPLLRRMGADVTVSLVRPGFFPAGGGSIVVDVRPGAAPGRLDLVERGDVTARRGRVLVSRIPTHVGEREAAALRVGLGWSVGEVVVESITDSHGPGNAALVEVECGHVTEVFSGFGERGVRAETVAAIVAAECLDWIESGVPVGPHLADQLLLPMALGAGGSFRTGPLTLHATTNAEVIREFLGADITTTEEPGGAVRVDVSPR
jgi:RNA 3'-terminal phosphate cyclase (ATP)